MEHEIVIKLRIVLDVSTSSSTVQAGVVNQFEKSEPPPVGDYGRGPAMAILPKVQSENAANREALQSALMSDESEVGRSIANKPLSEPPTGLGHIRKLRNRTGINPDVFEERIKEEEVPSSLDIGHAISKKNAVLNDAPRIHALIAEFSTNWQTIPEERRREFLARLEQLK